MKTALNISSYLISIYKCPEWKVVSILMYTFLHALAAVQHRFAKHCECPKSSCTATNA